MAKSPNLNRRQFVTLISALVGSIIGIALGFPAIIYLLSPALKIRTTEAWIPLGLLENYPLGQPTLFNFTRSKINGWEKTVNSYGVYILRKSADEVIVFSNLCTHLSCRVTWKDELNEFVCPCHDGHFDIDGKVVWGPPPQPLDAYQTKIEDGDLFIYLEES